MHIRVAFKWGKLNNARNLICCSQRPSLTYNARGTSGIYTWACIEGMPMHGWMDLCICSCTPWRGILSSPPQRRRQTIDAGTSQPGCCIIMHACRCARMDVRRWELQALQVHLYVCYVFMQIYVARVITTQWSGSRESECHTIYACRRLRIYMPLENAHPPRHSTTFFNIPPLAS